MNTYEITAQREGMEEFIQKPYRLELENEPRTKAIPCPHCGGTDITFVIMGHLYQIAEFAAKGRNCTGDRTGGYSIQWPDFGGARAPDIEYRGGRWSSASACGEMRPEGQEE